VAYTEQQYITTYLLGVQEAAMRKHEIWCHTLEQLSRQTPGVHKYSMLGGPGVWTQYGGTYHLCILGVEPGSCHLPGTWNFKLDPKFIENLLTPSVDCWQKDCWTGSFEGLNWGHRLCELKMNFWTTGCMTHNSVCITVNIPSGAHAGCNANSILRILCQFCYMRIFRQGSYMCYKFSNQF
jgi:hypothetical protein